MIDRRNANVIVTTDRESNNFTGALNVALEAVQVHLDAAAAAENGDEIQKLVTARAHLTELRNAFAG